MTTPDTTAEQKDEAYRAATARLQRMQRQFNLGLVTHAELAAADDARARAWVEYRDAMRDAEAGR